MYFWSLKASVSLLALALLSTPVMAMDGPDPAHASAFVVKPLQEERWCSELRVALALQDNPSDEMKAQMAAVDLRPCQSQKHSFSEWRLDPKKISDFLQNTKKKEPAYQRVANLLLGEVESENQDMSEQLYALLKEGPFNSRSNFTALPDVFLEHCFQNHHLWAYKAKIKKEGMESERLLPYHKYFANTISLNVAVDYLNTKYKDQYDNNGILKRFLGFDTNTRRTYISNVTTKWQRNAFAFPLIMLAEVIQLHEQLAEYVFPLYTAAASLGNTFAFCKLGCLYSEGFSGQPIDMDLSLMWHLKAAESGYPQSMYNAAFILEQRSPEAAWEWYQKASDLGIAPAMHNLSWKYETGSLERTPDLGLALAARLKAAELGHVEAMVDLDTLLPLNFTGHIAEPQRNLEWQMKAVENGSIKALYNIGTIMQRGYGDVPPNFEEAARYYTQAITHGDLYSMNNLGTLYLEGWGSQPLDTQKAWDLFSQAADAGLVEGMYNAAITSIYYLEQNPADRRRSFEYLYQAAFRNHTSSMTALGYLCLRNGDFVEAYAWFEKAAGLDDEEAKAMIELSKHEEISSTSELSEDLQDDHLTSILNNLNNPKGMTMSQASAAAPIEGIEEGITVETPSISRDGTEISDSEAKAIIEAAALRVDGPIETPQKITNPKYLRALAKEAGEASKRFEQEKAKRIAKLENHLAIDVFKLLMDPASEDQITSKHLKNLFNDPYFVERGGVRVKETKSGIAIISDNRERNPGLTAGAHRNHNKTYKGYHRNFLKEVRAIVNSFFLQTGEGIMGR